MSRDIERLAELGESCLRERMSETIERIKISELKYEYYQIMGDSNSPIPGATKQNFIEAIEDYRKMIAEMRDYGLEVRRYHDIIADITFSLDVIDLAEAVRRQRRLKEVRNKAGEELEDDGKP